VALLQRAEYELSNEARCWYGQKAMALQDRNALRKIQDHLQADFARYRQQPLASRYRSVRTVISQRCLRCKPRFHSLPRTDTNSRLYSKRWHGMEGHIGCDEFNTIQMATSTYPFQQEVCLNGTRLHLYLKYAPSNSIFVTAK